MADPFFCGLLFRLRYALRVQIDSDASRPVFLRGMNEDPSIAAGQVVMTSPFLTPANSSICSTTGIVVGTNGMGSWAQTAE